MNAKMMAKPMDIPEMKPHINLDEKILPDIKLWNVGKTYKIELLVEMTGMNKDDYMEDDCLRGNFTVLKAKPIKQNKGLYDPKIVKKVIDG